MRIQDYAAFLEDVERFEESPRIAMISTHGYVAAQPPLGLVDTGGQVVYVLEMSKKLGQLGFQVDIWTRRFEDQAAVEPVDQNVRIIRVPCGGSQFIPKEYLCLSMDEWVENAFALIKRARIRYRFLDSHYWDAGLAGHSLSDILDVEHLHTPHSLGIWKRRQMVTDFPDDEEIFESQYNFATRIAEERRIFSHCRAVVATTPVQTQLISQDYGVDPRRIELVSPGYDDNRFYPVGEASRRLIRARLGFEHPTILCLGRLASNKGYDLLIRSFAVTAERLPEVRLRLAVGGETLHPSEKALLRELKELAKRLGLSSRIDFASFIPDADLADYYRAADLFVLPSRYEPFGMTAIEAMACGTPTVVTTQGGLFQLLTFGRHALFGDPFDPQDLGIMMVKPFRHQKLQGRLARMGAHKVRGLFTWTGIAQQLLGLVGESRAPQYAFADHEWDQPWSDGD